MVRKIEKKFGEHYLIELIGCAPEKIKFVSAVKKNFLVAARKSRATILKYYFHQYRPHGVTGIILVSASHFSIHTWPEHNFAACDFLTCKNIPIKKIVEYLQKSFQAKRTKVKVFLRGF